MFLSSSNEVRANEALYSAPLVHFFLAHLEPLAYVVISNSQPLQIHSLKLCIFLYRTVAEVTQKSQERAHISSKMSTTTTSGTKRPHPSNNDTSSGVLLSNAILQGRLAMGLGGSATGARGSLTRCATQVNEYCCNTGAVDRDTLLRDFQHYFLEAQLLDQQQAARQQMIARVTNETTDLEQKTAQLQKHVSEQRTALQHATTRLSCEREYEALATLARKKVPTARRQLEHELQDLRKEHQETVERVRTQNGQHRVVQAQVQLIVQSINDLQRSLQEPMSVKEHTSAETSNMDVEGEEGDAEANKETDGDDGLYDGL